MKKPIHIDRDTWYYEHKSHIEIIHWIARRLPPGIVTTIKIPWKKLLESAARCRPESIKKSK